MDDAGHHPRHLHFSRAFLGRGDQLHHRRLGRGCTPVPHLLCRLAPSGADHRPCGTEGPPGGGPQFGVPLPLALERPLQGGDAQGHRGDGRVLCQARRSGWRFLATRTGIR